MHTHQPRSVVARAIAVIFAAVMALGASLVGAAHAADSSSIDPSAQGSITIHRLDGEHSTGAHANGLADTTLDAIDGIPGSVYTAQKVVANNSGITIDLTKESGWTALEAMAGAEPTNLGTGVTATADTRGVAKFENLDVGAYWVTETTVPTDRNPIKPFLMTIPFTHPTDLNQWVYDAFVYPKESTVDLTKAVNDHQVFASGNDVTWSMTAGLPTQGNEYRVGALTISDAFNGRLVLNADVANNIKVWSKAGATGADWVAVDASNYTISSDAPAGGWGKVSVIFDAAALKADLLRDAKEVRVDFTAVFDSLPDSVVANGNTPADYVDDTTGWQDILFDVATVSAQMEDSKGVPVGEPLTATADLESMWGTISLVKTTPGGGTPAAVEGAGFAVFLTEAAAKAALTSGDTTGALEFCTTATPKVCKRVYETNSEGKLTFPPVRYTAFANDEDLDDTDPRYQKYYVVEVKAASGYELSPKIAEVEVPTNPAQPLQFSDAVEKAGFKLPLAGGAGIALAVALGLLLAAGAFVVIRRESARGRA